jgi:hypothetical protein
LRDLVKLVAELNSDLTGEVVFGWVGHSGRLGDCGDGSDRMSTSFRTTMRERWSPFCDSLLETYSRAAVS